MENGRDALLRTIDSIKNAGIAKGTTITEEEIARKTGISEKQLYAYLNGKEKIPNDFVSEVMAAYNIRTFMVRFTEEIDVPDPSQDESEIGENNRMSLEASISIIKAAGVTKGIRITEEEMAQKIGISKEQIHAYLNGEDQTPDDLAYRLQSAYQNLLDTVQLENNRESLKRTVVWVRNCGLAEGRNITLEDMALKIGISDEQLYSYLNGKYEAQNGLVPKLESAYRDIFKDVTEVEIVEDINKIMKRPNSDY